MNRREFVKGVVAVAGAAEMSRFAFATEGEQKMTLKKALALLLTGLFILLPFEVLAEDNDTANLSITVVDDRVYETGETVSVEITLSSLTEEVYMFQFAVEYDADKLTFQEIQSGAFFSTAGIPTVNSSNPGIIYANWDSINKAITEDCLMFTVSFTVNTTKACNTSIAFSDTEEIVFANWNGEIDVALFNADIQIKPHQTPAPTFRSQTLLLSDNIGVNFRMELPEIEGVDYTTSYMTFAIPHGTVTERADFNGTGRFACYINSAQMAEPITATFHYEENGEEKTVEKTYSVMEYFETYDEYKDLFDETTQALIESLADYGHYMQQFLAQQKGWTLGTDYAEMTKYYATEYDVESIKTAANGYAISIAVDGADISNVSFTTVMESATAIKLTLTPTSGYTGPFTATVDGNALTLRKSGKRYIAEIPGIAAHNLSKTYGIVLTTNGGSATIDVSALSYVQLMYLIYTDATGENAASAFYSYSMAANAYKAAH